MSFLDITYTQYHQITVIQWSRSVGLVCQSLIKSSTCLRLITLWLHEKHIPPGILENCFGILQDYVMLPWQLYYEKYHSPIFGDPIDTSCYLFYVSPSALSPTPISQYLPYGYDKCVSYKSLDDIAITCFSIPV